MGQLINLSSNEAIILHIPHVFALSFLPDHTIFVVRSANHCPTHLSYLNFFLSHCCCFICHREAAGIVGNKSWTVASSCHERIPINTSKGRSPPPPLSAFFAIHYWQRLPHELYAKGFCPASLLWQSIVSCSVAVNQNQIIIIIAPHLVFLLLRLNGRVLW